MAADVGGPGPFRHKRGGWVSKNRSSVSSVLICICLKTFWGYLIGFLIVSNEKAEAQKWFRFSIEHLLSWSRNCSLSFQFPFSWGWEFGEVAGSGVGGATLERGLWKCWVRIRRVQGFSPAGVLVSCRGFAVPQARRG